MTNGKGIVTSASVVLAAVLAVGVVGLAQFAVEPRVVEGPDGMVFLFENETGAAVTELGIVFDQAVALESSDVVAFGGGEAGELDVAGRAAWIPVEVNPGGTLQVAVHVSDVQVASAYWVKSVAEKNGVIYTRFIEEFWNGGDAAVADEIIGSDWSWITPFSPQAILGAEMLKQFVQATAPAFPDLQLSINDYITEENRVMGRVTFTGTHAGDLMGIPATGKSFTFTDICYHRIEDGRIQESVQVADVLGLLQQIGVVPPMGEDFSWGTPSEVTGAIGDLEENRALSLRLFAVWDDKNLALLDEILAPSYVWHAPPMTLDAAGYRMYVPGVIAAFPDLDFTMLEEVAEADKVGGYWTATGTHQGDFMGIPPTGRQITITGIDIHRLADGKVVETWEIYDGLGLLIQLGVIPPPGG